MKTTIMSSVLLVVLLAIMSTEASAHGWGRHHRGCGPRRHIVVHYCPPPARCAPPVVYYQPRGSYCAPPRYANNRNSGYHGHNKRPQYRRNYRKY